MDPCRFFAENRETAAVLGIRLAIEIPHPSGEFLPKRLPDGVESLDMQPGSLVMVKAGEEPVNTRGAQ